MHLSLEDTWLLLRQREGVEPLLRVRHQMAFLASNWLQYVQLDVIEAQYAVLVAKVRGWIYTPFARV